MNKEIKIIVEMRTNKNAGLGRIFRTLRRKSYLETTGDVPLYARIIQISEKEGLGFTDEQIVKHFKNISKEEYLESEKREILKDLKRTKRSLATLQTR